MRPPWMEEVLESSGTLCATSMDGGSAGIVWNVVCDLHGWRKCWNCLERCVRPPWMEEMLELSGTLCATSLDGGSAGIVWNVVCDLHGWRKCWNCLEQLQCYLASDTIVAIASISKILIDTPLTFTRCATIGCSAITSSLGFI